MNKLFERLAPLLKSSGRKAGKLDNVLVIRLVIAAVIFALALTVSMPNFVRILLFVVSALAAGYDLVIDAINSVEGKDFFAASLLVSLTVIVSFVIGYSAEAAALVLVYQIGLILVEYVDERSQKSAIELLRGEEDETVLKVQALFQEKKTGEYQLADTIRASAGRVLKCTMILALLCVFLLPLLGDFTYRVSIHRALMILILCTPLSVVTSLPLVGLTALSFSAKNGVSFRKAAVMEKTAEARVAVFDMAGVFSQEEPRLLSVQSDILDRRTFMNFAAHAVYYSEQPFARAISAAYGSDYKLDVISDFREIPGGGVELKVAGNPVILATGSVFTERGIQLPPDQQKNGQAYYMTVAGRYIGRLLVSNGVNEETRDLAEAMQETGIRRCVLLTEEGSEESHELGEILGFSEVHGECDTEKKLQFVSELSQGGQNGVIYVYANGFEAHSEASVDVRVSKKTKFADAQVLPENLMTLPFAVQICKRMCELARENAILAFAVKAVLIFLSMTGYCSLWFAMLVDMIATIATQLNAIRVTRGSVLESIRNRQQTKY